MLRHMFPFVDRGASAVLCSDLATGAEAKSDGPPVLGGENDLLTGIPGSGPLKLDEIDAWLTAPTHHMVLEYSIAKGLDAATANVFVPEDNPLTRAKIELGRQLYFDTRLSSDNTISCASCHDPEKVTVHTRSSVSVSRINREDGIHPFPTIGSSAKHSSGTAVRSRWRTKRSVRSPTRSKWATRTKSASPT